MLNKAILVGRLTADPELKETTAGIPVTSFSVACNRPYSKGDERQADFIHIVAWRKTAEFISQYFHKGDAIGIDGSIQTRSYEDKSGQKRTAVEVVAEHVSFVGGGKGGQGSENAPQIAAPQAAARDKFEEVELSELDDLPW